MVFILSRGEMAALNKGRQDANDRCIADWLRASAPELAAELNHAALTARVTRARELAVNYGIMSNRLRMRWVMIDYYLIPDFWKDTILSRLLHSPVGTADQRFGDVCRTIRLAAIRAECPELIWWGNDD